MNNNDENTFGLQESDKVRMSILKLVKKKLPDGIRICDIIHKQYEELYIFEKDTVQLETKIYFNGKGFISRIIYDPRTEEQVKLSNFIKESLSIEGEYLNASNSENDFSQLDQISPDITDVITRLANALKSSSIETSLIRLEDYSFTLSFQSQDKGSVLYRCFFNKNRMLTSLNAQNKFKHPEICSLIEEAFTAIQEQEDSSAYTENRNTSGQSPSTMKYEGYEVINDDDVTPF